MIINLTNPIASMEGIHKSNFAYMKLLELQGKSEQETKINGMIMNQQDLKVIKSELNSLNLEILRK